MEFPNILAFRWRFLDISRFYIHYIQYSIYFSIINFSYVDVLLRHVYVRYLLCFDTAGVSASEGQMRLKVWVRMTWKLRRWQNGHRLW